MKSGVKFLGHAVHPMLIVFPLGLLVAACAFDIAAMATDSSAFYAIAYWNIVAGVIGGLAAALFGWLDWAAIKPYTRAKQVGLWHGIGNMIIVGMFAISGWMRYNASGFVPDSAALALSFGGIVLGLVTAWMGGELVERMGIAVDEGAHSNAPSSLSGRPATENRQPELSVSDRDDRMAA